MGTTEAVVANAFRNAGRRPKDQHWQNNNGILRTIDSRTEDRPIVAVILAEVSISFHMT
jgi:hypothetical protein